MAKLQDEKVHLEQLNRQLRMYKEQDSYFMEGEGADGVIGFLPADLYYYDSERDWDRVTCNSPPSNATGLATFTLEGTTLPTPPSLPPNTSVSGLLS